MPTFFSFPLPQLSHGDICWSIPRLLHATARELVFGVLDKGVRSLAEERSHFMWLRYDSLYTSSVTESSSDT